MPKELNHTESRLTEDLVRIIDMTSRVLNATPGSHYQWDKTRQLGIAVKELNKRLGGDEYQQPAHPVDPKAVEAAVAAESQYYSIGKALYGPQQTPPA